MQNDDLLIRPEKLEAVRKKIERKNERRERAHTILEPVVFPRKKPWWKRLFS